MEPNASHSTRFCVQLFFLLLLSQPLHPLHAQVPPAMQLFDTGSPSATPLNDRSFALQARWLAVPEDDTKHLFKGDAVSFNGKLALVLRKTGVGGELYALTPAGPVLRASLVPLAGSSAGSLTTLKLVENSPASVVLAATCKSSAGQSFTLLYEMKLGQPFVQTQSRSGVTSLRIIAPCRFGILPDFFADDIVVDAATLTSSHIDLPSDHFFMHMLADGAALVMPVWYPAQDDVRLALHGTRTIVSSEVPYARDGKIWICVLNGPGTWHWHEIGRADGQRILPLAWKPPYPAHWRVDWAREDNLTDSWEMLTQNQNGDFVKHGWYGQPESFGNEDWQQEGRQRWTTVLGFFQYPCWIDKAGRGFLQPLRKPVRFQGPALIYPITRLENTPLDQFTVVDLMRSTLGIGPCEYVLDVEGQKKTYQGRPTCDTRALLDAIYAQGLQKQKEAEVLKTLDEVIAFVRHIRGRIEDYLAFGREMTAWLEEQKKSHPALGPALSDLQATTRRMDAYLEMRKQGIKTPEYAAQLVHNFRTNLVGYQGRDALAKCKKTTAALVDIGGNQDELVGECRLVVKILRQRAALAATQDPRLAPIAKEIRRRTQQILRNPTSYEAPRH